MIDAPPRLPLRRAVGLALGLGAAATACGATSWLEQKKLGPVAFPHRGMPIMVFKSDYVRAVDRDGLTDAVVTALTAELWNYDIEGKVVALAGAPVTPRIELAFWTINLGDNLEPAAITVDCAFVSASDQVAFVGRIRGTPQSEEGISSAVEPLAQAIFDELASS
jgi:hypothetical protein